MNIPDEIIDGNQIIEINNKKYLTKPIKFKDFLYQGIYVGDDKTISLPLCYELSKTKFPRVTLSNQAAEKFTRGENAYRKAVIKGNVTGDVLVMNKQGDCIGFGKWENNLLMNVRDVGEYLRKEKENLTV